MTADGEVEPCTEASQMMHANDDVARLFGMSIVEAQPGTATVSMVVTQEMTNGLDVCHGGILFTLADTAMAHASNAANERTLSTSASIEWLRPALIGDRLTAISRSVGTRGRNQLHDIVITDQHGIEVALVRGQTLTLGGPVA